MRQLERRQPPTHIRRALQQRGIAITPGLPGKKYTSAVGRQLASTDSSILRRFRPTDPTIAVLGKCGERGFVVIDLDRNHVAGVDGVQNFKELGLRIPRTLVVRTPRGGIHLYGLWDGFRAGDHLIVRPLY